eukprot:gene8222-819_t
MTMTHDDILMQPEATKQIVQWMFIGTIFVTVLVTCLTRKRTRSSLQLTFLKTPHSVCKRQHSAPKITPDLSCSKYSQTPTRSTAHKMPQHIAKADVPWKVPSASCNLRKPAITMDTTSTIEKNSATFLTFKENSPTPISNSKSACSGSSRKLLILAHAEHKPTVHAPRIIPNVLSYVDVSPKQLEEGLGIHSTSSSQYIELPSGAILAYDNSSQRHKSGNLPCYSSSRSLSAAGLSREHLLTAFQPTFHQTSNSLYEEATPLDFVGRDSFPGPENHSQNDLYEPLPTACSDEQGQTVHLPCTSTNAVGLSLFV